MDMQHREALDIVSGDFVLAEFDDTRFVFDQTCVADAHAMGAEPRRDEGSRHFVHDGEDGPIPLVAATRQLGELSQMPKSRRFVLVLKAAGTRLGIACDGMQVLPRRELHSRELPVVMRLADSPVLRSVTVDDKLAFYCDAGRLIAVFNESKD